MRRTLWVGVGSEQSDGRVAACLCARTVQGVHKLLRESRTLSYDKVPCPFFAIIVQNLGLRCMSCNEPEHVVLAHTDVQVSLR